MPSPIEITISQLSRRIGLPDQPIIIDVCLDEDFAEDARIIPGARRCSHMKINDLIPELLNRAVVVVCHKGKKLSQGVVALLRSHGIMAESLEGGMVAWRDAGCPLVPASALPNSELWVTRFRPKIDRIACPWLIRRFINADARFLFVAPSEVENVADRFDATPFDTDGVFWSHRKDRCTFDTMLDEFALHTQALDRLALVVRAADTGNPDMSPQAAGLLAVSVGLSRQYKDDTEQVNAGMAIYDALYRWARDGFDEGHASMSGSGK